MHLARVGALVIATLAVAVPAMAHHPGADLDNVMGSKEKFFQAIDSPAPPFELANADGDIVRLSDFADKIVVLNFIFAGCADVCPLHSAVIADVHSTTMLAGVYFGWDVNAYIIDAIIGLSVVYKALDNLGAYQRWFGFQPNTKSATLIFGFFHGLGLATKILDYKIASDGLLPDLLAFNVGVEIGQFLALAAILIAMGYWRRSDSFLRHAYTANVVMMSMGFVLMGYQIAGYFAAT